MKSDAKWTMTEQLRKSVSSGYCCESERVLNGHPGGFPILVEVH